MRLGGRFGLGLGLLLLRQALRLVAKTPTLIANFDRHRAGKAFVRPNKSYDIATNFLWMLNGEKPTEAMAKT